MLAVPGSIQDEAPCFGSLSQTRFRVDGSRQGRISNDRFSPDKGEAGVEIPNNHRAIEDTAKKLGFGLEGTNLLTAARHFM